MMAAKLASYQPYVSANLTAEEAERYECFDMQALWKNFKGPCTLETRLAARVFVHSECLAGAAMMLLSCKRIRLTSTSMKHFNV